MIEVTSQTRDWGSESRVLMNSVVVNKNEAQAIHASNIASLNKMSDEQILESRKEIMERLDSSVLDFLKKKWTKPIVETKEVRVGDEAMINERKKDDHRNSSRKAQLPGNEHTNLDSYTCDNKLQTEERKTTTFDKIVIESQMFPHMDKVEPEKMEW